MESVEPIVRVPESTMKSGLVIPAKNLSLFLKEFLLKPYIESFPVPDLFITDKDEPDAIVQDFFCFCRIITFN